MCSAPIPAPALVARNMMLEAQAIGEKLGVKFPIDVDRRIEGGAEAVGAHRTSMLQDLASPAGRWRSTPWWTLGAGTGPQP
jgi:ketopantoate reductase